MQLKHSRVKMYNSQKIHTCSDKEISEPLVTRIRCIWLLKKVKTNLTLEAIKCMLFIIKCPENY